MHRASGLGDETLGLGRRFRVEVAADDRCAFSSESHGRGAAHPNADACDQRNLAGQP